MKDDKAKKVNPHKNHRMRLRDRYAQEGLASFANHNVIELVLFNAFAQKDTNEIAHNLLKHFDNSFVKLLEAPQEELMKVEGIGYNTALFLTLISDVARRYLMEKAKEYAEDKNADPFDKIKARITAYYTGYTTEVVALFCLNNRLDVISEHEIYRGSVNSSHVNLRTIIEIAFAKKAASIILTHNHPSGSAIPSAEDIDTTKRIWSALSAIELELTEHFAVAGDQCFPIMEHIKNWRKV